MAYDQWANQLNEYFSIFAIRVLVVSIFFAILLIWLFGRKYIRERKNLPVVFVSLFFSILSFSGAVPFLFLGVPMKAGAIIGVLITISPLILLFISYLIWMIAVKINKKREQMVKKVDKKEKRLNFFKPLIVIFLGLATLSLTFLAYVSVFSRPYIVLAGTEEKTTVDEASEIRFRLTVPVLKDSLEFTISPNQQVDIEYDYVGFSKNWVDGFTISPTENYPAESRLVIYVVGLSDIFPGGKKHEQSLEFLTPSLPSVTTTSLDNQEGEVSVETDLEFHLDKPNQKSAKWSLEVDPPVEFSINEQGERSIGIDFLHLAQGTTYIVKLIKGNSIYNTKTGDELRVENEETEKEISFKTIDAPGIKKYNWENVSLPNSEPLIVEFSDKINLEIFKDKYTIEPKTAHTLSVGNDGNSLILKPDSPFAKDTTYRVTFMKGLKTLSGGFFEENSTIKFKTAGVVRVIYFNPRTNGSGVSIHQKSVSVTFDQKVDKESAQNSFSILPKTPGTFSWNGNTMVYSLNSALPYYTKYTIKISPGVKSVYGKDSQVQFLSTFLTEEQTVILKVPQYYQPKGFDCNLYAAKMALAYKGPNINVASAKSSIGIGENPNVNWVDGYGVHWGPLASYISRYRTIALKSGWSVQGLASEIIAGNPIIVYVYNGSSKPYGTFSLDPGGYKAYMGMHSEVVVGFTGSESNPTSIITNDSWRGRRKHTIAGFNALWGYMGRIGIVVY